MTLTALKTILSTLTGTSIGEVVFDWPTYLNKQREKTYPVVFWSFDNASFKMDKRDSTIQVVKDFTITVFAITPFNPDTQDMLTEWDTLESKFDVYLNAMNDSSNIQIMNIAGIKGSYVPQGVMSADQEIAIMYKDVIVRTFCG